MLSNNSLDAKTQLWAGGFAARVAFQSVPASGVIKMSATITLKSFFSCLILLFLLSDARGQESQFRRVNVQNFVSIEIPSHWYIRGEAERRDTAAASEARTGMPSILTDLSVITPGEKVRGIIRVSVLTEQTYTQADFKAAAKSKQGKLQQEISAQLEAERQGMSESMRASVIEWRPIEMVSIGRIYGYSLPYRRKSMIDDGSFFVTRHYFPFGNRAVVVTLSYSEREGLLLEPIMDRVKKSILLM